MKEEERALNCDYVSHQDDEHRICNSKIKIEKNKCTQIEERLRKEIIEYMLSLN